MGGYGSTRWNTHIPKRTVESSLKLSIFDAFKQSVQLKDTNRRGGFLIWKRGEKTIASMRYALDLDDALLVLEFSANGQPVHLAIELTTTPCRYGGVRYWFECPKCQHRVACLYLKPGGVRFACRKCHDLAYTSAQEAHKWDRSRFATLAAGIDLFHRYDLAVQRQAKHRKGSKAWWRATKRVAQLGIKAERYKITSMARSARVEAETDHIIRSLKRDK
jgi:hypothetical protein